VFRSAGRLGGFNAGFRPPFPNYKSMPFSVFKHSIQTTSDTLTGDAATAINGNFVAIANYLDTVLVNPIGVAGITITGPAAMGGPSNPAVTLTSDGFGNLIFTNQGGGASNVSGVGTLSCQSVTSSNTLHALGAIVAANGVTFGDSTVQTTAAPALPTQTGNSGKVLTTNRTVASWSANSTTGLVSSTAPEITGAHCTIDDENAIYSFRGAGGATPEAAVSFIETEINITSAPIFMTDCSMYFESGSISGANLIVNSVVSTSSSGTVGQLAMIGNSLFCYNGTQWRRATGAFTGGGY
jgi:hypothetical protein